MYSYLLIMTLWKGITNISKQKCINIFITSISAYATETLKLKLRLYYILSL